MTKTFTDKKEVNPVVGVIIMVTITILTASTVYVYVSGMEAEPSEIDSYLEFQITPKGYPELYNKWDIIVWKVENQTHSLGDNVTITIEIIDIKEENKSTIYNLATDSNGFQSFYYNEPKNYIFKASAKGFESASFYPDKRYTSIESIGIIIDIFSFPSLLIMITLLTALLIIKKDIIYKKNKIVEIKNILRDTSIILSIVDIGTVVIGILLVNEISRFLTPYGYIENNLLGYLHINFIITFILTIMLVIIVFIRFLMDYSNKK